MERPRFQFTIRGILWATFWLAVSTSSWVMLFAIPNWGQTPVLVGPILVGFFGPFVAIGSLFGHPVRGLAWGYISLIWTFVALLFFGFIILLALAMR